MLGCVNSWLPDGYSQIVRSHVFGPSGFWTMAPLRYAAKFDPFLSLDCAPTPSTLSQSKERKGSNFANWQPCRHPPLHGIPNDWDERASEGMRPCSEKQNKLFPPSFHPHTGLTLSFVQWSSLLPGLGNSWEATF